MDRGWKPNVEVSPACPRCGSLNTKFCYYNNYSLTQPRYFCKGCRRYWTKGGSLRNVPVGGGCRKSRRGKSLRALSSSTGGTVSPRSSGSNGEMLESSNLYPGNGISTSIDLAAVYANFLNQRSQRPEPPPVELPELPYDQATAHVPSVDYMATNFIPASGYLGCGNFSDRSSEIQSSEEQTIMYFCGLESFQKQQQLRKVADDHNHQFTRISGLMDSIINSPLPPLPGEDVATSEGMVGSSFDLVLPNSNDHHIFQSNDQTAGIEASEQDSQQLINQNGNPFSVLNLEAIFRP